MWWIFVCKWPLCCHIVRDGKHDDISQRGGEEAESRMSTGGSRCRKRNERSPNMRGFTAVSKGLLQLVHKCWGAFFPVNVRFKPPSHWHFLLPPFVSSTLVLSVPSSPLPPSPKDIDLGRVATAALQLNMPEALRKAQMRCGAMDHTDLLSTVLIPGSAAASSLCGRVCHCSLVL